MNAKRKRTKSSLEEEKSNNVVEIEKRIGELEEKEKAWALMEVKMDEQVAKATDKVMLDVGKPLSSLSLLSPLPLLSYLPSLLSLPLSSCTH